jgi:hypothetical protein
MGKTPPIIDVAPSNDSPSMSRLNFSRPMKVQHPAAQFDIQSIIIDDKLDDVGIFLSFATALPLGRWRTISGPAGSIAWPIAPFHCAAVSAGAPLSFYKLQPRVTQFALTHDGDRIPSEPAMPFKQRFQ